MNDVIQLFNIQKPIEFDFSNSLQDIYRQSFSDDTTACSSRNFFIILDNDKAQESSFYHGLLIENKTLNKQKILIGKIHIYDSILSPVTTDFKKNLIEMEVVWIKRFLDGVVEHLTTRESEGRKLTNHNSIRMSLGHIINKIAEIGCLTVDDNVINVPVEKYISSIIESACNELAKLAGGRAFLAGSIIDMLVTFKIINTIYLA
ncbi:MAG: hypothetical protein HKM04_04930 [Legionellales bacterium]|nr:hypothetical protein [Legionellales bacterium]